MSECVIQVRGLGHTYLAGTPLAHDALRGVDMEVSAGQVVALVGPTGSGKSTLLQHLNGLLRPQTGQVHVLGYNLGDADTDLRAVRQAVGLVFQRPGDQLFEQYVGDDVAYGPRQAGLEGQALRERVRWAMESVGLDFAAYKDRLVAALSGGERRKVGLAGVLALRPQVLLLDEPTTGLDPAARVELLAQLCALHADGVTLILATHNMDDVAALADHVYVLQAGRVAWEGPTRRVFGEVERLRALGLDVPSVVAVVAALQARGISFPTIPLTVDEAEQALGAMLACAGERGGGERV